MIFVYDKDKIHFSFDIDSFSDKKYYENPTEENLPCWHPHEGMLVCVNTNKSRIVDLIRYYVDIPRELSFETLRVLFRDIWEVLQKNGYTNIEAYSLGLTIANSHEAYYLTRHGIIDRDDKLTAVSGGMMLEIDMGVDKDLPPLERLKQYYRLENSFYGRKNTPILLLSTDKAGVELLDL